MTEAKQELAEAMKGLPRKSIGNCLKRVLPSLKAIRKSCRIPSKRWASNMIRRFCWVKAAGAELQSVGAPGVD